MTHLSIPGDYIVMIDEYDLYENKNTGSVSAKMKFIVYKVWVKLENDEFGWQDREYGEHIIGFSNLIKTDGTVNEEAQQALMIAANWDGQIESIIDQTWKPWPIRITIENQTNKNTGKTRVGVSWINHADSIPGSGFKHLDDDVAKSIKARFASQIRASASAIKKSMQDSMPHDALNPAPIDPKDLPPQPIPPDEVSF